MQRANTTVRHPKLYNALMEDNALKQATETKKIHKKVATAVANYFVPGKQIDRTARIQGINTVFNRIIGLPARISENVKLGVLNVLIEYWRTHQPPSTSEK